MICCGRYVLLVLGIAALVWSGACAISAETDPCNGYYLNVTSSLVTVAIDSTNTLSYIPSKVYGRWPGNHGTWFRIKNPLGGVPKVTVNVNSTEMYPRVFVYMGNCVYQRFLVGLATAETWGNDYNATVSTFFQESVDTMYVLVTGDGSSFGDVSVNVSLQAGPAPSYDYASAAASTIQPGYFSLSKFGIKLTALPDATPFENPSGPYGRWFYYKMAEGILTTEQQIVSTAALFQIDPYLTDEFASAEMWVFVGNPMYIDALTPMAHSGKSEFFVEVPLDKDSHNYILVTGEKDSNFVVEMLTNELAASITCNRSISLTACSQSDASDVCDLISFLPTVTKSNLDSPKISCQGATYGTYGAWYSYTHADFDREMLVSVDNAYSNFDSQLFVFDSCDTIDTTPCLAYNDDNRPGTCIDSRNAQVHWDAVLGHTYYILLTGHDEGGGVFIMRVFPYVEDTPFIWQIPVVLGAVTLLCCCCRCCCTIQILQIVFGLYGRFSKRRKYMKRDRLLEKTSEQEMTEVEPDKKSDIASSSSSDDEPEVLDIVP